MSACQPTMMVYVSATYSGGEVAGMLGNFAAEGAGCGTDVGDARSAALHLMAEALARLDSDSKIPAAIGAQLQTAIDALWASGSSDPNSTNLH